MNIWSLKANLLEFDLFLSSLQYNIDIIFLTECWTESTLLYKKYFEKYEAIFSDKHNKSGGVAVFYNPQKINLVDYDIDVINGADSVLLNFDYHNLKNLIIHCKLPRAI